MDKNDADDRVAKEKIVIKYGKPIMEINWGKVKLITTILVVLLSIDVLFSFRLFVSAVQIRRHIGHYINMVSDGDGDILPSLQAVPVLFCMLLDGVIAFMLYKCFLPTKQPNLNRLMFLVTIMGLIFSIILLIIVISVIAHAYSTHTSLHDGIMIAMRNYSSSLIHKTRMDRLQIEFQCCGSKSYDEWYSVKWFDSSIQRPKRSDDSNGNTPFSCCSMKSLFPCIHHNIEITGKAYLYIPEFNLSISTRGCYDLLRETKQSVGWGIVGNLTLFLLLQGCTVAAFRLIQTAHFIKGQFVGDRCIYTAWLFGCYSGQIKSDKKVPELPSVPEELMQ